MVNRTSEKINELHIAIKEFDGGVKRWKDACDTSPQNFYKSLKSKTVTEKKKEIYLIGKKVLRDLLKEEKEFFENADQSFLKP